MTVLLNRKTICVLGAALILFVAGTALAFAQDEKPPEGWTGDASLSIGLTRGNSETTTLALSLNLKKEWGGAWSVEDAGSFMLTRISGETTAENMGLTSRIKHKTSARLFLFGEIQALRDRFKDYDYRFLPQVGAGWAVLKSEAVSLELSTGLTQVFTKYHLSKTKDSYTGLAIGNKWTWKISGSADLQESLSLHADFSDFSRYFMRLEVSLTSALTKLLAVKLSLIDSYDNKPAAAGIKKNDLAFLAGLSAKF